MKEISRKPLRRNEWLLFLLPLLIPTMIFAHRLFFSPQAQASRIIYGIRHNWRVDLSAIDRLVSLGLPAQDLVIAEIKRVQQHPEAYRNGRGYLILFRAAAHAKDKRALPYLKHLARDPDYWLGYYASQAYDILLKKRRFRRKPKRTTTSAL
jgi:hypothetical protein